MEFKKLALAIAISTALTACGGGGGSSSSSTPTSYSVSGTAAKGIIQHGIVTAEEYVGSDWKAVGNTTTDANGKYALTLSGYAGGPLRIKITADSSTTMKCDDVSGCGSSATFGQAIALSNDFSMAAILPSVTSTSLTDVPVTPYTNMAAHLAESSLATATDKSAAVNTALSTVTTIVGFNIATTPVVDITADDFSTTATADEQRAAAMSAALMSFTNESTSVEDVLERLASAIDDSTLDENDTIPFSDLRQAWSDTISDPTIQSLLSEDAEDAITNQVSYLEENLSDDGTYTPEPNENYGDSDVAKAKTLLTDTRSFIYNIIETDFDTPLNALDANASAAAEVFDKDSAAMVSLLGTALDDMFSKLTEDQVTAGGTYPVEVYSGTSKLGTLTLTTSNTSSGLSAKLAGSLTGTETGARTVTVNDLTISTNLTLDEIQNTKTTSTSYNLNVSGELSDGSTSLAVSNGQAVTTLSSVLADASGDTLTSALTGIELKNLDLTLKTDGATFAGNAAFKLVKPDATKVSKAFTDDFPLTLKSVVLKGDFTTKDSQNINASIGLDLGNSETFDLMAFLNDENTVWVYKDDAIDAATLTSLKTQNGIPDTASEWSVNYGYGNYYYWTSSYDANLSEQSYYQAGYYWNSGSPNYEYHGDSVYTQEAYDAQAAIYDPVAALNAVITSDYATITGSKVISANINVGHGYYWDANGQQIPSIYNNLYGEIQLGNYEESASNFLKVKATAAFELNNVAGLPNAKVSAVVDRNAFKGGSASLLVNWDAKQYTFKLDNVDLDSQSGALTVTDPTGTSLILQDVSVSDASATGALYVGTKKVADVKTLDNGAVKVSYIDGTFETLQ